MYVGCFGQEKLWSTIDSKSFSKLPAELISYYEKYAPPKEVALKRNVGDLLSFWRSMSCLDANIN